MSSLIAKIKVFFGYEVCPQCGSSNIIRHGFEGSNLRYGCQDCKKITYIWDYPI
jgi:transposase-like protein